MPKLEQKIEKIIMDQMGQDEYYDSFCDLIRGTNLEGFKKICRDDYWDGGECRSRGYIYETTIERKQIYFRVSANYDSWESPGEVDYEVVEPKLETIVNWHNPNIQKSVDPINEIRNNLLIKQAKQNETYG